jgi:transcriptional regulator with XRE-family HTH domain
MTSDPDDKRFTGDADMRALHRELQEPIAEEVEPGTETGDRLASALDHGMFSQKAQAFVNRLLSHGENPSPELRQRLTRAAARGVEYQRKQNGPLPILLAARREALHMDASTLASALGLSNADVYDLESGKRDVRTVEPDLLVSWIRATDTPNDAVLPSLRRALELTRATAGRMAAGRRDATTLNEDDEKLISRVSDLLQS